MNGILIKAVNILDIFYWKIMSFVRLLNEYYLLDFSINFRVQQSYLDFIIFFN